MANDNNKGKGTPDMLTQVANRIRESSNVLVALSKDPSIDELTAALGLTFVLDKLGKRATAIFSGDIPNIIEFLQPEKTFEQNTNSLQDFIIALDKEKADHIRYKIDGDYVKVYITPYKTTISEKDMEFSHGDFNVDLVISLNVASAKDLDGALTEYGRIMHDASSINISAAAPGKFADLEWGSPEASSISEMISMLSNELREPDNPLMDNNIATTLLTGIISATNRFSNERTTADTMATASALMAEGADQQLISQNVPVDILTQKPEPEPEPVKEEKSPEKEDSNSSEETKNEQSEEKSEPEEKKVEAPVEAPEKPVDPTNFEIAHDKKEKTEPEAEAKPEKEPEPEQAPASPESQDIDIPKAETRKELEERPQDKPKTDEDAAPSIQEEDIIKLDDDNGGAKRNIVPLDEISQPPEPPKDYAQMLDSELKKSGADKMYVPDSVDDSPMLRSAEPATPIAPPAQVEVPAAEIGPSGILPPPPVPLSAMMPPAAPEIEEPQDMFEKAEASMPAPSSDVVENTTVEKTEPRPEPKEEPKTETAPAPAEPVGHIPTANEIVAKLQKEKAEKQKAMETPVMPAVKLQIPSQPTVPTQSAPAPASPAPAPAPSAPASATLAPRPSTPPSISAASVPGASTPSAAPAPIPAPAPSPAPTSIQDDPGAFHIPGM